MLQPSCHASSHPKLVTLSDAITDSLVYRANIYHFDEQVDLLEKWLDSLTKHMKNYVEKLNKLNAESAEFCKTAALPPGLDESLIDPNFAGAVIKGFSSSLNKSFESNIQLISRLEEEFVQPMREFTKTQLKNFKEFRKDHEKALERYESQLAKYAEFHKGKEPSAVREEAFRLYEARRCYTRMSSQHVVRILDFRSALKHLIVDQFSSIIASHLDAYDESVMAWRRIEHSLSSWKQWLIEDKYTCHFHLSKLRLARDRLEHEYLKGIKPSRDMETYSLPSHLYDNGRPSLVTDSQSSLGTGRRWGYLFHRGPRNYWARRWFFLCDGHFGYCKLNVSSKQRGVITVGERVPVLLCDVKIISDAQRRYCFEVVCAQQPSFVLQAETESDMRGWITAFTEARQASVDTPPLDGSLLAQSDPLSPIPSPKPSGPPRPSAMVLSTSPDGDAHSLSNSISLSPFLVHEAALSRCSSPVPSPLSSSVAGVVTPPPQSSSFAWGIPWALVPGMFQGASNGSESSPPLGLLSSFLSPTAVQDGHPVIWPPLVNHESVVKVDLQEYDPGLAAQNQELRRLFGRVSPDEVVLDAFLASLKKKRQDTDGAKERLSSPSSLLTPLPSPWDEREREFASKMSDPVDQPPSDFGYSYTGHVYLTQATLWFYSAVLMTCINTAAIRLKDITGIRLLRDTSVPTHGRPVAKVLAIEVMDSDTPLILSMLTEDVEVAAEKLRLAVGNAKNEEARPLQELYDVLRLMSRSMSKKRERPSLTNKVNLEPIKVRSTPDLHIVASSSTPVNTVPSSSSSEEPTPLPSASKKKKKSSPMAPTTFNKGRIQPRSGALAAAMMAASVAGGSGFLDVNKMARLEEEPSLSSRGPRGHDTESVHTSDTRTTESDTKSSRDTPNGADTTIPSHIQVPSGPVSCECQEHLDKTECELELPVSAKQLYDMLFTDDPTMPSGKNIWELKAAQSECRDFRMTKWETVDGKSQRTLKYVMPVKTKMVKVKEAEVVETQVVQHKEEYIRYCVQISTKTAALPYADSFIPSIRYCITWVDETHSKLVCCMGVKFVQKILVRGMVERAALSGMAESIAQFSALLERGTRPPGKTGSSSSSHDSKSISEESTHHTMEIKTKHTQHNDILSVVWDILNALPMSVILGAIVLLVGLVFLRPGHGHVQRPTAAIHHGAVVSKAVYLRDLEEGLLQTNLRPASHVHMSSFEAFMTSRRRQERGEGDEWLNPRHHELSIELLFSRERIAMLRHDALVIFRMLNRVDAQLVENEYINWLMDQREKCQETITSNTAMVCEHIYVQLRDMPLVTSAFIE